MGKSLIKRVTSLFAKPHSSKNEQGGTDTPFARRTIPEQEHRLSRKHLDDNAMKVVYGLSDKGHEAYLVGGCIRDALLNQKPKDFDVATSAEPEVAHEIFKRSRLIGRRFKLLHVRFGRDIIEVATFRAGHDSKANDGQSEHGRQNAAGMITRDNVYGSLEDDAGRRDFTANALYYDGNEHCIYDFCGGYEDIQNNLLKIIGDPEDRYREDPVRMLRAARFAGKLGFTVEPRTAEPIFTLGYLLKDIAPARLFDESLKLFQSGYAEAAFNALQKFELFEQLYPETQRSLDGPYGDFTHSIIINALRNTDRRIQQRKSVTPAFLYAVLLWVPMTQRMQLIREQERMAPLPALHEAANQILSEQVKRTAIPRRFSTPIREIWELQLRLERRDQKRAERILDEPRFRAAYDLLVLREQSGEDMKGLAQWWTDYQNANPKDRSHLSKDHEPPRRRRRPRKRPPAKKEGA